MDIQSINFFSPDFFRSLREYFIIGAIIIAPLFQIFRMLKLRTSGDISLWTWITVLCTAVIILIDDFIMEFNYFSENITENIFTFGKLLMFFFIAENIVLLYFILKFKQKSESP